MPAEPQVSRGGDTAGGINWTLEQRKPRLGTAGLSGGAKFSDFKHKTRQPLNGSKRRWVCPAASLGPGVPENRACVFGLDGF